MPTEFTKKLSGPVKLSVLMPVYNERYLIETAVERVLAFSHPLVRELELIVVDDGSTDGTRQQLRELAARHPRIRLFEQAQNQGKGSAIRRAIREATGDLSVIQDADLEYYPQDWARLLQPFFEADADVVYGSRFLPSDYRRVLYYWHTIGNRILTTLSNFMTDLNLSDMETCYKMVRTELLKSIPIRSNDFRIEPELTAKLVKRGAAVYEVPVRYAGRTYREGKKIGARDGFLALSAIVRWKLVDDLYQDDAYGSDILDNPTYVQRFNEWLGDLIAPDLGERVLELNAGIGNLTRLFLPRKQYLAADAHAHNLAFLDNMSVGKPYLRVARLDPLDSAAFAAIAGQFDSALCVDVLEHCDDDTLALRNLHTALEPGGRVVVVVPGGTWLFSSLDEVLKNQRRYDRERLSSVLEAAGFEVESIRDYNRTGVPGWLINGKLLGRRSFPKVQLKIYNTLMPLLRELDRGLPWGGLGLIAVGRRR